MEKRWKHLLLPCMAAVCLASLLVMAAAVAFAGRGNGAGQFVPPPFDSAAKKGVPEVPEGTAYGAVDAEAFVVSICGKPGVRDGKAVIWLTSPEENDLWLKCRILDEDGGLLGETGLIKPGEYVEAVDLKRIPAEDIPVQLRLMSYEPDTYYSGGTAVFHTTLTAE